MKTKISETRLKDALLTLENSMTSRMDRNREEQEEKVEDIHKKLKTKLNDFQDEVQIEFGGIN
jgi:hypothetical protein